MLQSTARGLARLQRSRVAALTNLGLGAYTGFISRMVEFLRQYESPACDIYNNLQPREYAAEVINRRRGDQRSAMRDEELMALLEEVSGRSDDEHLDREFRDTFPSIATIATFAAQNPGSCRRLTVLDSTDAPEERQRQEVLLLDRLMKASDAHYLIPQTDAGRAVDPLRLHQSDFAIWSCEEVVVLTDYYPASSTLLVSWKLPSEENAFLDYYEGVFAAVITSPSVAKIRDVLDR